MAESTQPVEVCVEVTLHSAEEVSPNRTSLASMLPAGWLVTPAAAMAGLAWCSATDPMASQAPKMIAITPRMAAPWRMLPVILPNVDVRETGMHRISTIDRKFVNPGGFSNGLEPFGVKYPPPFVPICLLLSCGATGPRGMASRA